MYAISWGSDSEEFCFGYALMPVQNLYFIRTHQKRKLESTQDDHEKNLMNGQPLWRVDTLRAKPAHYT